jgi:hypothetical protein
MPETAWMPSADSYRLRSEPKAAINRGTRVSPTPGTGRKRAASGRSATARLFAVESGNGPIQICHVPDERWDVQDMRFDQRGIAGQRSGRA